MVKKRKKKKTANKLKCVIKYIKNKNETPKAM